MNKPVTSDWLRPAGIRGLVDGGTAVVVLLWVGILFLVPSRPISEKDSPPAPTCMISAWPTPLADLPLDLLPDLVTLPSAVSFGAGGPSIDSLQGVPSLHGYAGKPLPPVVDSHTTLQTKTDADLLRESAAASLLERPVFPVFNRDAEKTLMASSTILHVLCSPSLGGTQLSSVFRETFVFPKDINHFEAELWVQFGEGGMPKEIFIERTDDKKLASSVVRQLWNPVNWTNATGYGGMRIRYRAGAGGINANQKN